MTDTTAAPESAPVSAPDLLRLIAQAVDEGLAAPVNLCIRPLGSRVQVGLGNGDIEGVAAWAERLGGQVAIDPEPRGDERRWWRYSVGDTDYPPTQPLVYWHGWNIEVWAPGYEAPKSNDTTTTEIPA